jgi:hypothetical protein
VQLRSAGAAYGWEVQPEGGLLQVWLLSRSINAHANSLSTRAAARHTPRCLIVPIVPHKYPTSHRLLCTYVMPMAGAGRSFGVVLWEIITKQAPVRGHLREVRDDEAPPEVQKLLEDCINIDVSVALLCFCQSKKRWYSEAHMLHCC